MYRRLRSTTLCRSKVDHRFEELGHKHHLGLMLASRQVWREYGHVDANMFMFIQCLSFFLSQDVGAGWEPVYDPNSGEHGTAISAVYEL